MEPVLVVLIIFGSILALAKMTFDHRRSKLLSGNAGQGSLGMSELKRLIEESVQKAVQPVVDRLDQLDATLHESETKLLDEPLDRSHAEESAG